MYKVIILFAFVICSAINAYSSNLNITPYFDNENMSCYIENADNQTNEDISSLKTELTEEDDAKDCYTNILNLPFTSWPRYIHYEGDFVSKYIQNIMQPPCLY